MDRSSQKPTHPVSRHRIPCSGVELVLLPRPTGAATVPRLSVSWTLAQRQQQQLLDGDGHAARRDPLDLAVVWQRPVHGHAGT